MVQTKERREGFGMRRLSTILSLQWKRDARKLRLGTSTTQMKCIAERVILWHCSGIVCFSGLVQCPCPPLPEYLSAFVWLVHAGGRESVVTKFT